MLQTSLSFCRRTTCFMTPLCDPPRHGVSAALPLTCDPAVRNAAADVTDDVGSFHVVDHYGHF